MPVLNNYNIIEYHGNSNGRTFNFPFRCYSLDHLIVEYTNEEGTTRELLQSTEYSVTDGLSNNGGSITFPLSSSTPPLTENETIRIYRSTPMAQEIDYPVYQQAIENALDKSAMVLQEVATGAQGAKQAIDSFQVRVTTVESEASTALSTANSANTKSDTALTTANTANTTATAATTTANNADSKVDTALETIAQAVTAVEDKVSRDGHDIEKLKFLRNLGLNPDTGFDFSEYALKAEVESDFSTFKDNIATDLKALKGDITTNITLTDEDKITLDWEAATHYNLELHGNRKLLNPINTGKAGIKYIRITQDSIGSRTLEFDGRYVFENDVAPTLSTDPLKTDILRLVSFDGSTFYATLDKCYDLPTVPRLSLSNYSLAASAVLGNSPANQSFSVVNAGELTLNFQLSEDCDWLELNQTTGSTTDSQSIDITYNTTGLAIGNYTAVITATSDNGDNSPQILGIDLRITEVPDGTINTSVSSLSTGAFEGNNAASQTFDLTNTGGEGSTLTYNISTDQPWLSIDTTSGTLQNSETDTITITYDTDNLIAGTYTASINITSAICTNSPVMIPVTMQVFTGYTNITVGSVYNFSSSSYMDTFSVARLSSAKAIVCYRYSNSDTYLRCRVLNLSGTSISSGSEYSISGDSNYKVSTGMYVIGMSSTKAIVGYKSGSGGYGYGHLLTISGTSVSGSSPVKFDGNVMTECHMVKMNDTQAIAYMDLSIFGSTVTAKLLTISGSSVAVSSRYFPHPDGYHYLSKYASITKLTDTRVLVAHQDYDEQPYHGDCMLITLNGSSLSLGSMQVFSEQDVTYTSVEALTEDTAIVCYNNNITNKGACRVLTISGDTITAGEEIIFNNSAVSYITTTFAGDKQILVCYRDSGNSNYGTSKILTAAGTSISVSPAVVFNSGSNSSSGGNRLSTTIMENGKAITGYKDTNSYGRLTTLSLT